MFKNKYFKMEEGHSHDLRGVIVEPVIYQDSEAAAKCLFFLISGKKRSWTNEEDAYLIKLVQKYGAQKWTTISENLPGTYFSRLGRIGKQCR